MSLSVGYTCDATLERHGNIVANLGSTSMNMLFVIRVLPYKSAVVDPMILAGLVDPT